MKLLPLMLLVMAIARPQSQPVMAASETNVLHTMLVLDISMSMLAEDFQGKSRLDSAKEILTEFVARQRGEAGLILFARDPFPVCPLTSDDRALTSVIERAQVGLLEDGTAIGNAIVSAVKRLTGSDATNTSILLLTDGENNYGIDPIESAQTARQLGIRINVIGIGSASGAPIPISSPIFGRSYLRDEDGNLIIAKLDETTLRRISDLTGGAYFHARTADELDRAYQRIFEIEQSCSGVMIPKRRELFPHLSIIAAVFVLIQFAFSALVIRQIP